MKKLIYLLVLQMFVVTGMAFAVGDTNANGGRDPMNANAMVQGIDCKDCIDKTLAACSRDGTGPGCNKAQFGNASNPPKAEPSKTEPAQADQ